MRRHRDVAATSSSQEVPAASSPRGAQTGDGDVAATRSLAALFLGLAVFSAPAADDLSRVLPGADIIASTLTERSVKVVQFIGAKSFAEADLRAAIAGQLQEIAERGLTPARADDAAYYLGAFYRKKGYAKVNVSYDLRGGRVVLRVEEGPRTLLRRIVFAGNRAIPTAQLFDYMAGATAQRIEREPEQFPFTKAGIEAGAERVRGLYVSEGYLDATVDGSAVEFSAGGTRAAVTVKIVEGPRYFFGAIRFEGDAIFPRATLLAALGEKYNGPFSSTRALNMQRNLQSYYKAHGYYQATVAVDADPLQEPNGGSVPVLFVVKPDGIFRFGAARVKSDRGRLRPDFLPLRFAHLRGKVYDPAPVDETYREMLRTGLFRTLRVTPVAEAGHIVALDIFAEEAPSKEVGFTLGYGSYEGATAGIRLGDRDLFGRGRPLTFSADFSQRGLRGELLYVDPWLFDSRFSMRARLFSVARDEEGYSKKSVGGRLELGRRLTPHFELAAFIQEESAQITDVMIDPPEDIGPPNYLLTNVGLTASYDRRNDPINPTRGFIFSSSIDLGLLDSGPAFTRGTLRFSYYQPVGPKCYLALGARAGLISPMIESIPIDVRFFNGGATTVRSFAERDLGPKDKGGHPLGGEFYSVLNAEFTFPLISALQGAVFVDAGNLAGHDEVGASGLRYAIGLGLRYRLPVGPLRIDYGVNPDPQQGEDFGAFHFSFGFAF